MPPERESIATEAINKEQDEQYICILFVYKM